LTIWQVALAQPGAGATQNPLAVVERGNMLACLFDAERKGAALGEAGKVLGRVERAPGPGHHSPTDRRRFGTIPSDRLEDIVRLDKPIANGADDLGCLVPRRRELGSVDRALQLG